MVVESPSARERRLARELRRLRAASTAARQGRRRAAGVVGRRRCPASRPAASASRPTTSTGCWRSTPSPTRTPTFLRRLAPSARPKGWWDAYADTLSAGYAEPDPPRGRIARPPVLRRAGAARAAADPRLRPPGDPVDLGDPVAGGGRPARAGVPAPAGRPRRRRAGRSAAVPRGPRRVGAAADGRRPGSGRRRRASCAGSSSGSPRPPAGPTSRSRCCRSPPACRR